MRGSPVGKGVVVAIAGMLCLLAWSAPAWGSVRYQTYPTCHLENFDYSGRHAPSHNRRCHLDDAWGAVFIVHHDHNVHYTICIRRPDRSHDCYHRRTYGHGSPDGFYGSNEQTGVYRFTWRLKGTGIIDRDRLRLKP